VQATAAGSSPVAEAELVDKPRKQRRIAVYVGLATILVGAGAAVWLMWFQPAA
jgi:ferric-dicitrate binding protein FerR (iron transport regulator)